MRARVCVCVCVGVTFPEAVEYLIERFGVALPEKSRQTMVSAKSIKEYEVLEAAAKWFSTHMVTNQLGGGARMHLRERGVSAASVAEWRLGYAPIPQDFTQSLAHHLSQLGFDHETMHVRAHRRRVYYCECGQPSLNPD